MKMPKLGTWVRVHWTDASQSGKWEYGEENDQAIEISSGLFRGVTKDGKMMVAPTISVVLKNGDLAGYLTELKIPVGCVTRIERLPDLGK